jgi:hypothetical protein
MIALLMAATIAASAAPGAPRVSSYLRDQIHVYGDDYAYIGVRSRKDLPKPSSLTIVSADPVYIKVRDDKGANYTFRASEILTEGAASKCQQLLAANRAPNHHLAAGDVGSSSGVSSNAVPCVR